MLSKLKKTFFFIFFYLIFDLVFSSLFFNLLFFNLEEIHKNDIQNRILNKDYKYTFKPNASWESKYNDFIYQIETNNFGFRDYKIRKIMPTDNIFFFAGDSFLEGVGLDFENTLLGKLKTNTSKDNVYLNSGVASYSPYLYKRKIKSFIKENPEIKLKKVIILFDKSDPIDDQLYINHTGVFNDIVNEPQYKINIFEKSITIAFFKLLLNVIDEKQRDIKYRYLLAEKLNINFFSFTTQQINALKSIGNRRSISDYYIDPNNWNLTKKYIRNSINNLKDIEFFLSNMNIQMEIFIFPWSFELVNKPETERYINFINEIKQKKN